MTQPIIQFQLYIEEFKDDSQRTEAVSELVNVVQKRSCDLLSDTRQQLATQFEQFIKQLIYSKVSYQELAAIDIIINLLNTENPIIQLNLLEPYVLQLCNFRQTCFEAAHLIPMLYNINKQINLLNLAWEQVEIKFENGATKVQAASILTHICHLDLERAKQYIKHAWDSQYIECYCQLLLSDIGLDFLIEQLPKQQGIAILKQFLIKMQSEQNTRVTFNDKYEEIIRILVDKPKNVDIFGLLSRFNSEIYSKYLDRILTVLLNENNLSEVSIIVNNLGEDPIRPHFKEIFQKISESNFSASALTCIKALAQNCNSLLNDNFASISTQIFQYGLTKELVEALKALRIPELETKLLQLVAVVVSGVAQFGINLDYQGPCSTRIDLALKSLLQFQFERHDLTDFCCNHVVRFLTHESKEIRKYAGEVIIKHVRPNHINFLINQTITEVLVVALTDMQYDVRTSISGMFASENSAFNNTKFDDVLAQQENIEILFISISDQNFTVRSNIFKVIGRVSKLNPTIVLPKVREIFLNLVFELNQQKLSKNIREEALELMNILVSSCEDLIQPFYPSASSTLFKILDANDDIEIELALSIIQKLFHSKEILSQLPHIINYIETFTQSKNEKVRKQAIITLKDIVMTTGMPILPFVLNSELLERIIDIIKTDEENSQLAIKAFVTVGAIDNEENVCIPEEICEKFNITLEEERDVADIVSHGKIQYDPITGAIIDTNEVIKKQYSVHESAQESELSKLIFNTIIDIMDTNENQEIETQAIVLLRKEIKTLDANSPTVKRAIESLLNLLQRTDKLEFKEMLLKELVIIISFMEKKILPYSLKIVSALFEEFGNEDLLIIVFTAIEEIVSRLPDVNFVQRNNEFVQKLLELYSRELANEKIIIKSYNTITLLLPSLSNQITLLIPSLLKLIKKDNKILQMATLDVIGRIVSVSNVVSLSSLLVHTLLQTMKETAKNLVGLYQGNTTTTNKIGFKAFWTLELCACSLGNFFIPFVSITNQYMVDYQYYSVFINALITLLLNNIHISEKTSVLFFETFSKAQKSLDDFAEEIIKCEVESPELCNVTTEALCVQMENFPTPECAVLQPPQEFGVDSLKLSLSQIDNIDAIPQKDWVCDDENDAEEWRRWMDSFSLSAIFHSPDPKIHDCYELAREVPALAKKLFNYTFLSFINQNNMIELRKTAEQTVHSVFSSVIIPQDIEQEFLDLIEFLEHNQSSGFSTPPLIGLSFSSNVTSIGAFGVGGAIECDEFNLAKISDRCFAYARSLRFKEHNFLKQQTRETVDALINANSQLKQFESIKGLIAGEEQKANNTCASTIVNIIAKEMGELVHHIRNSELTGQNLLVSCYSLLQSQYNEDRKLLSGNVQFQEANQFSGSIGGIFLEGRELNSEYFSSVMTIESRKVSAFLIQFIKISLEGLNISAENKQLLEQNVVQNIIQLSDLLQLQFSLKPKYYEYLQEYDLAIEKYEFEIEVLYKLICERDLSRLNSELKQHQYLYTEYIQCLFNLGKFDEVLRQSEVYLTTELHIDQNELQYNRDHFAQCIASYCTQSAYETGNQRQFDKWIKQVSDPERSIFLILESIKDQDYSRAIILLDNLFDKEHPLVMAGIFESYQRAEPQLLLLQNLNEISEAIAYKLVKNEEEQRALKSKLKDIWQIRLDSTGHSEYYLKIRELVFDLSEDYDVYLSYAQDCIQQRKYGIAKQVYNLLGTRGIENPKITLEKARFESKIGNITAAYELIDEVISNPSTDASLRPVEALAYAEKAKWVAQQDNQQFSDPSLICDVLKCISEASNSLDESSTITAIRSDALELLEKAAEIDENNIEIFNQLGNVAGEYIKGDHSDKTSLLKLELTSYCKCIKHNRYVLQNLLKSIELWYGNKTALDSLFRDEIKQFNRKIFVEILPQLLSKKDELVYEILNELGLEFPGLMAIPLSCATYRVDTAEECISRSILNQMLREHAETVQEIIKVQNELIRIATLKAEYMLDSLFVAIEGYNQNKRQLELYNQISVIYQNINETATTENERRFQEEFLQEFNETYGILKDGLQYNKLQSVETAKERLTELHKKILEFDEKTSFELDSASPYLAALRNSNIVVFGQENQNLTIMQIYPELNIIKSKQRPRKMAFIGSDGELYAYLLKGREDLRLDERVMQLFELENHLFDNDFCIKNGMHINRYPVIPLGRTQGLLFWVPHADTVHSLIKQQRELKQINERAEEEEFSHISGPYAQLSLSEKLNSFKEIVRNLKTSSNDLRDALWAASTSAEDWLRRRNVFTVTLAVMSAAGHVLGLGDRHPQNIMLLRRSSEVLHIDFGDSFEATQMRSKLPEKVPFRLTRMLVNALEAAGVNGLFLSCFTESLRVFRAERDSILAIIETFKEDQIYRDDEITPEQIIERIHAKLEGRELGGDRSLSVVEEASALLEQAMSVENICQSYIGWCPFW